MTHLIVEEEEKKTKYEPFHRKVLIYKQFIPLLDITVLTITD